MITSGCQSMTMLILMIMLSFTVNFCSGLSCVHCMVHDESSGVKADDPCVAGPFESYQRSCCPAMTNPFCGSEWVTREKDGKILVVSRGCAPRPIGRDGEMGCNVDKTKTTHGKHMVCKCEGDDCNTINPFESPEGVSGTGGAGTPVIHYGTMVILPLATFVALTFCHAFAFV